jgi:hypothetical protein
VEAGTKKHTNRILLLPGALSTAESEEVPPFSPELPPVPSGFTYPGSSEMATVAAIDWKPIAHKLPIGKDAASKEKRAELFMRFDPNGNGYLSLAEVDKGVR